MLYKVIDVLSFSINKVCRLYGIYYAIHKNIFSNMSFVEYFILEYTAHFVANVVTL